MKKTTSKQDIVTSLSLRGLCRFCRTDEAWVIELVEEGVLEPRGNTVQHWRFEGAAIARARRASRLTRDLGINTPGVAMVLQLLDQRDALRRRLAQFEDV